MSIQQNRSVYFQTAQYPELSPITERQLERVRVRQSRQRKQTSQLQTVTTWLIIGAVSFGLVQATRTLVADAMALSVLQQNQPVVEQYYQQAQAENQRLREKIEIYSSAHGIEELARNSLNMVSEDEILVRLL